MRVSEKQTKRWSERKVWSVFKKKQQTGRTRAKMRGKEQVRAWETDKESRGNEWKREQLNKE